MISPSSPPPYPAIPTLPCPLCSYTSPRLYPHLPGILHLSQTLYLSQTRPTCPKNLTPPKTVSTSPQHLPSDLTPLQNWIPISPAASFRPYTSPRLDPHLFGIFHFSQTSPRHIPGISPTTLPGHSWQTPSKVRTWTSSVQRKT